MKKLLSTILICSLGVVMFSCGYINSKSNDEDSGDIRLVSYNSWFSSYEIEDGTVKLYCYIYVQNDTEIQKDIKIQGEFVADWKSGLLSENILFAKDPSNGETTFSVFPGSTRLYVVFCSNYGGGATIKQHKLLPKITIICTEDDM